MKNVVTNIHYEVVWVDKNRMYVWDYRLGERDMSPLDLPVEVNEIYSFAKRKTKAVMVYRLEEPWSNFCSHCSNKNFGDSRVWLKQKGFKSK